MSRWRSWCLSGLLLLAALVGALAVTEVAVRLVSPQPTGLSHQDRYGLGMHYPGITRFLPQYGHEVSFNSVGMRDREHFIAKPPGTYRILLLGDSFMEALQVPFDASLPSLLEATLSQGSGRRVEVINAGVSGWGTDDELRYLIGYGLQYQPDLVLVAMTLHNDISDNLREEWHTVEAGALVERPRAPMSYLRYKVVALKAYIATRFQLYQLWRRVRHGGEIRQTGRQLNSHIVQLFQEPTPERIARGFLLTELLLQEMRDISASHGAQLALVLLPLKVQLTDSIFSGFVEASGVAPSEMPAGKPQRVMLTIAQSLGTPVVDLLPGFRERSLESDASLYMEWDGHWNEAGHRLAADIVARSLIQRGLLR